MIKQIINMVTIPIMKHIIINKYGGVWCLKEYLQRQGNMNTYLLDIYNAYFADYGSWISAKSRLADVPIFPHSYYGIFISSAAVIGNNAVIFQHVTIGSNTLKDGKKKGAPTIGDNVYIGAGAKIIGNINIGDNCRIGANAVVYEDMPPHSVAVQSPTRIIKKENLDNHFYSMSYNGNILPGNINIQENE
jgi:serine O-acetyltransferase